jgi:hypothetical protein
MKQSVKIVFFSLFALLGFVTVQAQDVIHRKNGKTLEVKVLEINSDDVKYKLFTQPDGITYAMDVTLVKKIVFANGTVQKFEHADNFSNPEYYEGQNRSAYKISFLSQLVGYTAFTYEHNLKPGRGYELRLGFVGAGRDISNEKPRGLYAGAGYKFYFKPDYYTSRSRYGHLLKGSYMRPEINLGSYSAERTSYIYTGTGIGTINKTRANTTYGSVMLCAGKQWIFDNQFAVDFFVGVGMGVLGGTKTTGYEYFQNTSRYGNTISSNGFAGSIGINLGILGK